MNRKPTENQLRGLFFSIKDATLKPKTITDSNLPFEKGSLLISVIYENINKDNPEPDQIKKNPK